MLHCRFLRSKKSNGSFWNSSRIRSQNSDRKSRWLHNQYEIAYFGSRRGNVLYVLLAHNFARMVKNLASNFFLSASFFRFCYVLTIFRLRTRIQLFSNYDMGTEACPYVLFQNYGVKSFLKDQLECTLICIMHVKY